MRIAARAQDVEPFYVMEQAKAAIERAQSPKAGDQRMLFLNIGEPDFTAPPLVQEAAERAVRMGRTQYTMATGMPALREAISNWYATRFGANVEPERIIVTAGASAALQLACLALIEQGDEVLMPDPCYPCNRHFVRVAEGRARMLACGPEQRFQLNAGQVHDAWNSATRGVLLASPSNPTGTSIAREELERIARAVRERGGVTLIDEIYLGLSYEDDYGHTALGLPDGLGEEVISINSFSKYFNLTGWRLGWIVAPKALVPALERLAQNLFICPNVVSQQAAIACFEADSLAEYERRRAEFKARRDYFIPALESLGLKVPVAPDGAFYAWADVSSLCEKWGIPLDGDQPDLGGSWTAAYEIMDRCQIAVTPGRDFGQADTRRYIRLSTSTALPDLKEAVARLKAAL
jgi:aspartate/methionine/tyrosine aminotransferase